jgi:glycosyltransferase involved in cell wall biosynthesis
MKVAHITSVHPWNDTRVYSKMCRSLSHAGVAVTLICSTAPREDDFPEGVPVLGVEARRPHCRFFRMTLTVTKIVWKVLTSSPDIVHFHDPELIPACLALKMMGFRVIYDVHEDYQITVRQDAYYLPKVLRGLFSQFVRLLEGIADKSFDGIVTATPHIGTLFKNPRTIVVQNFPIISQNLARHETPNPTEGIRKALYVGSIAVNRGVFEMMDAVHLIAPKYNVQLILAGTVESNTLLENMRRRKSWISTRFIGAIPPEMVPSVLNEATLGLVCFHPHDNHIFSYPTKLFEYMAAGLPVVASDFPLWRRIIEDVGCGIVVDPLDIEAISAAITWLLDHPDDARAMGARGREAVKKTYNWNPEFRKLLALYKEILEG